MEEKERVRRECMYEDGGRFEVKDFVWKVGVE
jgi:hypothetical protein